MSVSTFENADCHYGDHHWRGGICTRCYMQFRCFCGRFIRVEDIDAHLEAGCPSFPPDEEGGKP